MRIPNLGETELLVPLHDGMFEKPMWDTFLKRLRLATGCDVATLLLRSPDSSTALELSSTSAIEAPRFERLFDDGMSAPDSSRPTVMRENRVYDLPELLGMADASGRDIMNTVLVPYGLSHMRAIRMAEESGLNACLVIASRTAIPSSAGAVLAALGPHVRVALRVLSRLERERAHASMNAGAFSHIDFGWIALDRKCRIVDMDEQADRFLSRTGALRQGPYGRLMPSSPAIDRDLSELVKRFADDPDARPRAVNLSQDPWIDILVSPVRVASLSAGGKAVAVVYFRGDQNSSADRCQQLIDVFKLTQSEARFAWSLAQGISIADAAHKHGLTIESARNYSKKIYAKTGARGQVDFMRRVLTSVVALTVH